jgi:hypothetical protein
MSGEMVFLVEDHNPVVIRSIALRASKVLLSVTGWERHRADHVRG